MTSLADLLEKLRRIDSERGPKYVADFEAVLADIAALRDAACVAELARFFDDAAGIGGAGAASLLLGSGDVCGGTGKRFHGIVGDESRGGGKHRQGHPRQPDPAGGRGLVRN
jgi:hypothetical protein